MANYPIPYRFTPLGSNKIVNWADIDGATQQAILTALGSLSQDQITALGITQGGGGGTPQTLTKTQILSILDTLTETQLVSLGVTKANLLSILDTLTESERQTLGITDGLSSDDQTKLNNSLRDIDIDSQGVVKTFDNTTTGNTDADISEEFNLPALLRNVFASFTDFSELRSQVGQLVGRLSSPILDWLHEAFLKIQFPHTQISRVTEDTEFGSNYFDYRSGSENYLSSGVSYDDSSQTISGLATTRKKIIGLTSDGGFGSLVGIKDGSGNDVPIIRTETDNILRVNSTGLRNPTYTNLNSVSSTSISIASGDHLLIEVLPHPTDSSLIRIEVDILRADGTILELNAVDIPHNNFNWDTIEFRHWSVIKGMDLQNYVGHPARRGLLAHTTDKWAYAKALLTISVLEGVNLDSKLSVQGNDISNPITDISVSGTSLVGTKADGSEVNQTLPSGGGSTGGLTAVSSDDTLSGTGTNDDPLKVSNPFTAEDETKLDGVEAEATKDEKATLQEVVAGANDENFVTPFTLQQKVDTLPSAEATDTNDLDEATEVNFIRGNSQVEGETNYPVSVALGGQKTGYAIVIFNDGGQDTTTTTTDQNWMFRGVKVIGLVWDLSFSEALFVLDEVPSDISNFDNWRYRSPDSSFLAGGFENKPYFTNTSYSSNPIPAGTSLETLITQIGITGDFASETINTESKISAQNLATALRPHLNIPSSGGGASGVFGTPNIVDLGGEARGYAIGTFRTNADSVNPSTTNKTPDLNLTLRGVKVLAIYTSRTVANPTTDRSLIILDEAPADTTDLGDWRYFTETSFAGDIGSKNYFFRSNYSIGAVDDSFDSLFKELGIVQGGSSGGTELTDAEIKTKYENNADTNAFTDNEKSKLSNIEANATADQTASEIKSSYESNSDTNAFTDSEKTKLAGIEEGAEVNDTKPEILTKLGTLSDSEQTGLGISSGGGGGSVNHDNLTIVGNTISVPSGRTLGDYTSIQVGITSPSINQGASNIDTQFTEIPIRAIMLSSVGTAIIPLVQRGAGAYGLRVQPDDISTTSTSFVMILIDINDGNNNNPDGITVSGYSVNQAIGIRFG